MADDILVSKKKSPTSYGENSNSEDFAESIAEYIQNSLSFKQQFPNRTALIEKFIKVWRGISYGHLQKNQRKTPNGGDYSEIFYLNDKNDPADETVAPHFIIRECKNNGELVSETFAK